MSGLQVCLSVMIGQALTIAAVVMGVLITNSRFGDLRAEMSARFSDMRALIEAHAAAQEANLRRVEEMLLGKFAELDTRLSRIEAHLNLH